MDPANSRNLAPSSSLPVADTPAPASAPASAPAPGTPSHVLAFLTRPRLPERASGPGIAVLREVGRLYLLDIAIMAVLAVVALLVVTVGFDLPANQLEGLEFDAETIALIVIGAPVFEELAFRSWLSGRPGHILALIVVAGGLIAAITFDDTRPIVAMVLAFASLIAGAMLLYWGRLRGPMRWFAAAFPVIFYLATLAFALVHLFNYTEGALYVLLPLVVPQFVAGALFGYARVQYGLWAAILLHALHNGGAVLLIVLAGQGAGAGAGAGAGGQSLTAVPLAETISIDPVSPMTS